MNRSASKAKRQEVPGEARNMYSVQFLGGNASNPASRAPENDVQPGAAARAESLLADAARLTAKESERFMHIVGTTAKITRHYELFRLLQTEVQHFIPHQILLSTWVDFPDAKPKLEVISPLRGVRTGQLNGCGIDVTLKGVFTSWVAAGRRPLLFDDAAAGHITMSECNCALHLAMRRMRSVLVHGIRNERDNLDTLYVALNPFSVKNGQSTERFFFLVDSVIAQIDLAFRKVGPLKSTAAAAGEYALRGNNTLSAREQEIASWIAAGKTNAKIAAILGISFFTVKNHAQRIFRKLDVTNRTEAAARYHRDLPAQ